MIEWAENKGLKVFDLAEYLKRHRMFPFLEEIKDYDVVISAEPTFAWIGIAIRDEIIRKKHYQFSAMSAAQAYALDREILFKRIIGPFLALPNKIVFQQRSFISSIVYQPVHASFQGEQLNEYAILALPGNHFVFENYSPDLLMIMRCDSKIRMERERTREKKDNAWYEQLEFQQKLEERYNSKWLRGLLEPKGTKVRFIDTNPPATEEDTRKSAVRIWTAFLNKEEDASLNEFG